jgi:hypothetical protein
MKALLVVLLLIATASAIQLDETTTVIGCGQAESCWMQMSNVTGLHAIGCLDWQNNVSLNRTAEAI